MISLNKSKNIGFEINTRISNTHDSVLIGSNINQNLKNANIRKINALINEIDYVLSSGVHQRRSRT